MYPSTASFSQHLILDIRVLFISYKALTYVGMHPVSVIPSEDYGFFAIDESDQSISHFALLKEK